LRRRRAPEPLTDGCDGRVELETNRIDHDLSECFDFMVD